MPLPLRFDYTWRNRQWSGHRAGTDLGLLLQPWGDADGYFCSPSSGMYRPIWTTLRLSPPLYEDKVIYKTIKLVCTFVTSILIFLK